MGNERSNVGAIREFFEGDAAGIPGRKVTIAEFKALTREDRAELGQLAREALAE